MDKWTNGQMRRIAILALFLALSALLAACDNPLSQKVIVVTATPTPEQIIVEVTATPSPVVMIVTATPSPEPAIIVTATPSQPSLSPEEIATAQAILTAQAANLTATAMATPTDTPVPPTDTPVPTVKPTVKPTAKPTAKPTTPASLPPPVLLSPNEEFSCFNAQGCNFSWSWGGSLAANQYFQVQLVGPGKEHRGIHPPTKGYSFQSSWSVYQIIRDWCDPSKMCHMQWTVAIIEWDGVDPSKIGRNLVEAAPRWVWL
jgi:hypothetical protein